MNIFEIVLLSITICIDSFILCLLTKCSKKKHYLLIPLSFSLFQCLFLFTGYVFGNLLENSLQKYVKYIIFLIFSIMGLKLMLDTILNKGKIEISLSSLKTIFIQSIITSFDSLFLGMPIAFNDIPPYLLTTIIGTTTFILCIIALLTRKKVNNKYDDIINIIGSIILFIFAFKSLI